MRRRGQLHIRSIALLALVVALGCEAALATATTPLPPDLVGLEQQMAQLQANSERFSFQEEISLGEFLGKQTPLVLLVAGDGEASDSPAEASYVGGLFGLRQVQKRVIGDTTYTYKQSAAEIDGGRPWVSHPTKADKEEASALDPSGILGNDQSGQQGTFSKLIEQLNGAQSIEESGPATVDGQRVIEFDATLNPAPILAQLRSKATPSGHPLSSLLETSPVGSPKAPAKPSAPPSFELEAFIAPNGLPVRIRFTFAAEGTTLAVRVDTLAINIPVTVVPPPAAQTIEETQLKQIERRRAARAPRSGAEGLPAPAR
ncbi:MAG: hypothetical protein ABR992_09985 [Solirubrobacteraceae bacterium]|jgi:hypothetical protein